ncbi:MAG: thioesterase family protein [Hyphomicrobiaceae bacterium]
MKDTLFVGEKTTFEFVVPANKTVPHLYPEAPEFAVMPTVFATGFMVGLMEWACLKQLEPHLEDGEGSLGTHIDVSHVSATVPGQTVTVDVECEAIDGRKATFLVKAHDGIDLIGEGRHQRSVVHWDWFERVVNKKAKLARLAPVVRKKSLSE